MTAALWIGTQLRALAQRRPLLAFVGLTLAVTLSGFLASWGIVGLHLFFYLDIVARCAV